MSGRDSDSDNDDEHRPDLSATFDHPPMTVGEVRALRDAARLSRSDDPAEREAGLRESAAITTDFKRRHDLNEFYQPRSPRRSAG
ncbi:hypothetical protein [Marinactinospora rubrisoli]|uniref:Uncharacterized protein n=1 Tax=Marinactinospora rubrisoli TaxID=2715399 RepID=A0ABW2KNW5_9ACTN